MSHSRQRAVFRLRPRHVLAPLFLLVFAPTWAAAATCVVPDNGGGTVSLPPAGCGYVSPADLHMMIDGLPPGTTIEVAAEHRRFFNISTTPGGSLGGEVEQFQSELHLVLEGTGDLTGFSRKLVIFAQCETHTGPRTPGDPVQDFDTDMFRLQGQISGDPDFDLLRITAGTGFGLPSPGHTTLSSVPGGNFNVDSFFDITYRIDFVGAPGSVLGGMSGSTTGTIRMGAGEPPPSPPPPCVVPNTGGTVKLPPAGCGYVSPQELHMMIDGLPPGTTIEVAAEHRRFFSTTTTPGGSLGGEVEKFQSELHLVLDGTGDLAGFQRDLTVLAQCETHTGPRTPGDVVQSFDTDMFRLQGQISGDPDFDLLRITAGTGFGLPSPGHTTLTLQSDGNFNIDSFFDITYRIDFVGAPGGALAGMSGSTTGTIRMQTGVPVAPPPGPCVVADNGSGTVNLPPPGCGYVSPQDLHMMIDGLPPGTEIHVAAEHSRFFDVNTTPGGLLGGEVEQFKSGLVLVMTGTGDLATFHRTVSLQAQCETHTAPRTPGHNIQSFDTDMFGLQGQLPPGDPDFDLLRITAGTGFGLPSPGHTTLTRSPGGGLGAGGGSYNVDSFFDITYEIEFVGAPGGALAGHSGTTTGTIRMQAGQPTLVAVPDQRPLERFVKLTNSPNPFSPGTVIQYRLPTPGQVRITVYDVTGKRVRGLLDARLPAGPHAMMWDGRDDIGRRLGSGTYFIQLDVNGKKVASRKALLVR